MTAGLAPFFTGLDRLLHREVLRLRARYQLSLDEFRGLYVSDEQVDALIRSNAPDVGEADIAFEWKGTVTDLARAHPHLRRLAGLELSPHELALLLMATAPAFDAKYDAIYAYLNNDVTRKLPTLDLALRLFSDNDADALAIRGALMPSAPLPSLRLLRPSPGPYGASAAADQSFAVHPGLANHLLGLGFHDEKIADAITVEKPRPTHRRVPAAIVAGAAALISRALGSAPRPIVIEPSATLTGTGFLLALCALWNRSATILDLGKLARDAIPEAARHAVVLAWLNDTPLLIVGLAELRDKDGRAADLSVVPRLLRLTRSLVLIAAAPAVAEADGVRVAEQIRLRLPPLDGPTQRRIWTAALAERGMAAAPRDLRDVAARFRLTIEAVEGAARSLADSGMDGSGRAVRARLFAAARAQCDGQLAHLAQRVPQCHDWTDLVLPDETRERVRGLIAAIAQRGRVLGEWGLAGVAGSTGLRALFAGSPGTGKTMTAGIIAREVGIDAYKIDLSRVVSKYIGETEKNLEQIFQAASGSNAVLFFDEADALFGKRSEVKDAHDRYSNIEVAYLLQRIEDFDGVAILATNVSRNLDAAFSRRMHFVIEFPPPGPVERGLLWRGVFPETAPLATDIDYDFLAHRFELAGGDIRNIAIDAAFLAARDEARIGMPHLVQAVARELAKQGRSPSATEFRQHYALLDQAERA